MSLRVRFILLSALAFAVIVVLVTTVAYFAVESRLRNEVDDSLENQARRLAELEEVELAFPFFDLPIAGPKHYLQVVRPNGDTLRPDGQRVVLPVSARELAVARGSYEISARDADVAGHHIRIVTVHTAGDEGLQFARSVDAVDATLSDLRWILLGVGVASVAVGALLALLVAAAILRPVKRLTRAAEHVAATQDLAAAIDDRRRDELGRLAASINAMLAALDDARRQHRQIVNDASHELGTPLTSLRTNIEVLARQPDMSPADRDRLLADVTSQLEELTALMDDVVELAQDQSVATEGEVELDLAVVVADAVRRVQRRVPDTPIEVFELEPTPVSGRRLQLERAVVNLLDNACKWSPAGVPVEVRLHAGTLTISDRGPGIAPDDRAHVFDRFYRSRAARSMPGSGLGLTIVRRVVDDHGGSVTLADGANGGTIATLRLPVLDGVAAPVGGEIE